MVSQLKLYTHDSYGSFSTPQERNRTWVLLILSVTATRRVHRSGGPRLAPQTPQGGEGDDYGQC